MQHITLKEKPRARQISNWEAGYPPCSSKMLGPVLPPHPAMQRPAVAPHDGFHGRVMHLVLDEAVAPLLVKLDLSDGAVNCTSIKSAQAGSETLKSFSRPYYAPFGRLLKKK